MSKRHFSTRSCRPSSPAAEKLSPEIDEGLFFKRVTPLLPSPSFSPPTRSVFSNPIASPLVLHEHDARASRVLRTRNQTKTAGASFLSPFFRSFLPKDRAPGRTKRGGTIRQHNTPPESGSRLETILFHNRIGLKGEERRSSTWLDERKA